MLCEAVNSLVARAGLGEAAMERAKVFFATLGAIGAGACVLYTILFFVALHYGAAAPAGEQIYRIADHSDAAYIGYVPHVIIRVLAITMLAGLGTGVPGVLLIESGERWMKGKRARQTGQEKRGVSE
jgi:hypothetical protein